MRSDIVLKNENDILKIATYRIPSNMLDPASINFDSEYDFIEGLYGTLMRFNSKGIIELYIAENYSINGNSISFKIRKGIETIDGHIITASDVENSFKRLLILNKNSHGKLENFLNLDHFPGSIDESCSCITTQNNTVTFNLINQNLISSFLMVIASADFSIIPNNSIDRITLKIKDYRNTSGPYFIENIKENIVTFKKNVKSSILSVTSPETVEFHAIKDSVTALNLIEEGKIDLFPTYYPIAYAKIKKYLDNPNFNIHQTLPIKLSYLQFTKRGLKRFNLQQRRMIGNYLREKAIENLNPRMKFVLSKEFFSSVGRGSLNQNQIDEISQLNNIQPHGINFLDVSVRCMMLSDQSALEYTKLAQVKNDRNINDIPFTEQKYDEQPDVILQSTDAAFYDSLTLLGYMHYSQQIFDSEKELKTWITRYTSLESESGKEEMINKLHFEMLKSGIVFPIGFRNYYAISRKPWKVDAPKMYAGTPLWMIHKE